jgi:hypothetical protein
MDRRHRSFTLDRRSTTAEEAAMGLVLVELVCVQLLVGAVRGSWRSYSGRDRLGTALCTLATVGVLAVAASAALAPGAWSTLYTWVVHRCFGGLQS